MPHQNPSSDHWFNPAWDSDEDFDARAKVLARVVCARPGLDVSSSESHVLPAAAEDPASTLEAVPLTAAWTLASMTRLRALWFPPHDVRAALEKVYLLGLCPTNPLVAVIPSVLGSKSECSKSSVPEGLFTLIRQSPLASITIARKLEYWGQRLLTAAGGAKPLSLILDKLASAVNSSGDGPGFAQNAALAQKRAFETLQALVDGVYHLRMSNEAQHLHHMKLRQLVCIRQAAGALEKVRFACEQLHKEIALYYHDMNIVPSPRIQMSLPTRPSPSPHRGRPASDSESSLSMESLSRFFESDGSQHTVLNESFASVSGVSELSKNPGDREVKAADQPEQDSTIVSTPMERQAIVAESVTELRDTILANLRVAQESLRKQDHCGLELDLYDVESILSSEDLQMVRKAFDGLSRLTESADDNVGNGALKERAFEFVANHNPGWVEWVCRELFGFTPVEASQFALLPNRGEILQCLLATGHAYEYDQREAEPVGWVITSQRYTKVASTASYQGARDYKYAAVSETSDAIAEFEITKVHELDAGQPTTSTSGANDGLNGANRHRITHKRISVHRVQSTKSDGRERIMIHSAAGSTNEPSKQPRATWDQHLVSDRELALLVLLCGGFNQAMLWLAAAAYMSLTCHSFLELLMVAVSTTVLCSPQPLGFVERVFLASSQELEWGSESSAITSLANVPDQRSESGLRWTVIQRAYELALQHANNIEMWQQELAQSRKRSADIITQLAQTRVAAAGDTGYWLKQSMQQHKHEFLLNHQHFGAALGVEEDNAINARFSNAQVQAQMSSIVPAVANPPLPGPSLPSGLPGCSRFFVGPISMPLPEKVYGLLTTNYRQLLHEQQHFRTFLHREVAHLLKANSRFCPVRLPPNLLSDLRVLSELLQNQATFSYPPIAQLVGVREAWPALMWAHPDMRPEPGPSLDGTAAGTLQSCLPFYRVRNNLPSVTRLRNWADDITLDDKERVVCAIARLDLINPTRYATQNKQKVRKRGGCRPPIDSIFGQDSEVSGRPPVSMMTELIANVPRDDADQANQLLQFPTFEAPPKSLYVSSTSIATLFAHNASVDDVIQALETLAKHGYVYNSFTQLIPAVVSITAPNALLGADVDRAFVTRMLRKGGGPAVFEILHQFEQQGRTFTCREELLQAVVVEWKRIYADFKQKCADSVYVTGMCMKQT